jgi:hypothetical protein
MKEQKIMLELRPIKEIVCTHFGLHQRNLNNYTRKREVLVPRQIYHYFARKYTNKSLSEVGNPYDHATVLHSVKTTLNRIETERYFNILINEIENKIKNYFYLYVGNTSGFRSIKDEIISSIIRSNTIIELNESLIKFTKKTEMKTLKNSFENDLNAESSTDRYDKIYLIGGEMRNVTHFGRYGTALREFDINLFNKMFADRLTALLQVSNMEVVVENIAV